MRKITLTVLLLAAICNAFLPSEPTGNAPIRVPRTKAKLTDDYYICVDVVIARVICRRHLEIIKYNASMLEVISRKRIIRKVGQIPYSYGAAKVEIVRKIPVCEQVTVDSVNEGNEFVGFFARNLNLPA